MNDAFERCSMNVVLILFLSPQLAHVRRCWDGIELQSAAGSCRTTSRIPKTPCLFASKNPMSSASDPKCNLVCLWAHSPARWVLLLPRPTSCLSQTFCRRRARLSTGILLTLFRARLCRNQLCLWRLAAHPFCVSCLHLSGCLWSTIGCCVRLALRKG